MVVVVVFLGGGVNLGILLECQLVWIQIRRF